MNRLAVLLCIVAAVSATKWDASWRQAALAAVPPSVFLHAPYTPFDNQLNINVSVIPALAANAKSYGVSLIWTCGGMGEFYTMTANERNMINAAWSAAGQDIGLYVVAHVGTTVQSDAIAMAAYAKTVGADAVATVPPYYEHPGSIDQLIEFMRPIAEAAYPLPLFYYHIPGSTGYNIAMKDLLDAASTSLPALLGIKFVSSDNQDWMNIVYNYNSSHVLLYAPEPKLQHFAVGLGRGCVLAEDFYAPTYIRMHRDFLMHNSTAMHQEQQWKYKAEAVFSQYGGDLAKRALYQTLCNVDMGPRRAPTGVFNSTLYPSLVSDLKGVGFFDQL